MQTAASHIFIHLEHSFAHVSVVIQIYRFKMKNITVVLND